MLKRNEDGVYYISEKTGKRYHLDQGYGINGDKFRSSDIVYILDAGFTEEEYKEWLNSPNGDSLKEEFVGFSYGAGFIAEDDDESIEIIKEIIDEYENRVNYDFTFKDLDFLYGNLVDNALVEFEKTKHGQKIDQSKLDINIRVGDHYVTVPYTDDNYIRLNNFILDCRAETVDLIKEKEENDMANTKQNYMIKKTINNSCYPGVFQNVFKLLLEKNVDGWYAMEFLAWLYRTAAAAAYCHASNNVCTDVFFAIYDTEEVDLMNDSVIKYGMKLKDCMANYKKVNFYRIQMSEDCGLDEIVPKCKTIDEQILDTLLAYQATKHEVLEDWQNKDLEEQIEYMRQKIKEDSPGKE